MERAGQRFEDADTKTQGSCLVVEDNEILSELITAFLTKNGIATDCAENGRTGLERYLENPLHYDAIFTDIFMPGMDGCEMAAHIRASDAPNALTVPIIALSGSGLHEVSRPEVFTGHLKKPFDFPALINLYHSVTRKGDTTLTPARIH